MSGKRLVDLGVLTSMGVLTLTTAYLLAIHVDIAYPLTEGEWRSYQLRGVQGQEVLFFFATWFGWFGAAYHFAGRWAQRKR